mmetsp:Transcript_6837/g.28542  ORF Transcript_6837/g.28542 Transcript_6837/m.28542 type:complete len:335 (+) Transcript_6837:1260-2264(+)
MRSRARTSSCAAPAQSRAGREAGVVGDANDLNTASRSAVARARLSSARATTPDASGGTSCVAEAAAFPFPPEDDDAATTTTAPEASRSTAQSSMAFHAPAALRSSCDAATSASSEDVSLSSRPAAKVRAKPAAARAMRASKATTPTRRRLRVVVAPLHSFSARTVVAPGPPLDAAPPPHVEDDPDDDAADRSAIVCDAHVTSRSHLGGRSDARYAETTQHVVMRRGGGGNVLWVLSPRRPFFLFLGRWVAGSRATRQRSGGAASSDLSTLSQARARASPAAATCCAESALRAALPPSRCSRLSAPMRAERASSTTRSAEPNAGAVVAAGAKHEA